MEAVRVEVLGLIARNSVRRASSLKALHQGAPLTFAHSQEILDKFFTSATRDTEKILKDYNANSERIEWMTKGSPARSSSADRVPTLFHPQKRRAASKMLSTTSGTLRTRIKREERAPRVLESIAPPRVRVRCEGCQMASALRNDHTSYTAANQSPALFGNGSRSSAPAPPRY